MPESPNDILVIISLGIQSLTLLTLVLALLRMFKLTAESRAARITLAKATKRAEEAANLAAVHVAEIARVTTGMAADIKEVATNTNSIMAAALAAKDTSAAAQVLVADAAGERRGIDIGVAQEVAKKP